MQQIQRPNESLATFDRRALVSHVARYRKLIRILRSQTSSPATLPIGAFPTAAPAMRWLNTNREISYPEVRQPVIATGTREKREEIASLKRPADWNGMGAPAITKKACDDAVAFFDYAVANGVPCPDYVVPSALGAVAFEWRRDGKNWYVRVHSRGPDGCFFQWEDSEGHRGQGRYDIHTATNMIKEFASIR